MLHKEGIQLLDKSVAPKDTKLRPKKYQNNPINISETDEWKLYSNWIDNISQQSIARFYNAGNHGSNLNDPIIVCNAAVYTWNYTKHLMERKEFEQLTQYYQPLFNLLRKSGHDTETIFLCDLTNALALGYMNPHVPRNDCPPNQKVFSPVSLTPQLQARKKSAKVSNTNMSNKNRAGKI